jgi:hypothetical protein
VLIESNDTILFHRNEEAILCNTKEMSSKGDEMNSPTPHDIDNESQQIEDSSSKLELNSPEINHAEMSEIEKPSSSSILDDDSALLDDFPLIRFYSNPLHKLPESISVRYFILLLFVNV